PPGPDHAQGEHGVQVSLRHHRFIPPGVSSIDQGSSSESLSTFIIGVRNAAARKTPTASPAANPSRAPGAPPSARAGIIHSPQFAPSGANRYTPPYKPIHAPAIPSMVGGAYARR